MMPFTKEYEAGVVNENFAKTLPLPRSTDELVSDDVLMNSLNLFMAIHGRQTSGKLEISCCKAIRTKWNDLIC
jgi:hypothetical protein